MAGRHETSNSPPQRAIERHPTRKSPPSSAKLRGSVDRACASTMQVTYQSPKSLWKDAAIDAGRADIVAHVRPDAVAPWVGVTGAGPSVALRHVRVLEFVERQVFRLRVDRHVASRAEAARHCAVGRNIGGVVPVV